MKQLTRGRSACIQSRLRRCNVNCNYEARPTLHLKVSPVARSVRARPVSPEPLHPSRASPTFPRLAFTWCTLEPNPRDCIGRGREICMLQRRVIVGQASASLDCIAANFLHFFLSSFINSYLPKQKFSDSFALFASFCTC